MTLRKFYYFASMGVKYLEVKQLSSHRRKTVFSQQIKFKNFFKNKLITEIDIFLKSKFS